MASLKDEVALEKAKSASLQDEAASQQGAVLHAFGERLFRSGHFSKLVTKLVGALNSPVTSAVIDAIAEDYLKLDKVKYGYEVSSREELLRDYAEVLVEYTSSFPVIKELASRTSLLSAEDVQNCPNDRDAVLEVVITSLTAEAERPANELETESADVGQKNAEAEQEAGNEEDR